MFQIEYKLRYLTKDDASKLKIMAIYDCCRVEMSAMPGLVGGRGNGCNSSEEDQEAENIPCRYFHIQACGPGGIAEADGGFAERIFNGAVKFSNREPINSI